MTQDPLRQFVRKPAIRGAVAWLAAALLFHAGCASAPPSSAPAAGKSAAKARSAPNAAALAAGYLDRFTSGSMAAKQAWDLASAAINAGDFPSALSTLQDLQAQTELTPGQAQAVKETIIAVQASMNTTK